jgi:hypothetical protein
MNVIQELNKNISGIDFIYAHRLTYDVIARQVKFAGARTNSIAYLKKSDSAGHDLNNCKSQV